MFDTRIFSLTCCNVKYSLKDPYTYRYLKLYSNIPTKKHIITRIDGIKTIIKVAHEFTLILDGGEEGFTSCYKCNSTTAKVYRYDSELNLIKRGKETHTIKLN